jgi:hypothetical protein
MFLAGHGLDKGANLTAGRPSSSIARVRSVLLAVQG